MDTLDVILSTEVLAGIVIVAALAFIVRAVLSFTSEAAKMTPKLTQIESDLTRIREGMADKSKLRDYHDGLRTMELNLERNAAQNAEYEQEEKQKRAMKRRMGVED